MTGHSEPLNISVSRRRGIPQTIPPWVELTKKTQTPEVSSLSEQSKVLLHMSLTVLIY